MTRRPWGRVAVALLAVALVLAAGAAPAMARGTKLTLRDSPYGHMLWGPKRHAVYAFDRESKGRPRCYGRCAEDWPPVYARGKPRGGRGVRKRLLGTVRRRGGRRQVTYHGRPLYFYAHEGRGQVLCHNVFLNGGLWVAVGGRGRPKP